MSSMFQGCFFDIFIINSNLNNIFIEQINTDLYLKGISLAEMNSNLKYRLGSWNLIISFINNVYNISNSNYKIDCYIKSFNVINKFSFCGVDYYKVYNDIANINS